MADGWPSFDSRNPVMTSTIKSVRILPLTYPEPHDHNRMRYIALARIETIKVFAPAGFQSAPLKIELWFSRAVIDESQRQARSKLSHNMLMAGGTVALAGMLLGFLLGWTMTRRILRIASALRQIGAGQIEARVESPGGSDELSNLAQDVNNMADRLQELNQLKKTFVTSITHELRSPLSVIE